jgi:hypothetical protein
MRTGIISLLSTIAFLERGEFARALLLETWWSFEQLASVGWMVSIRQ